MQGAHGCWDTIRQQPCKPDKTGSSEWRVAEERHIFNNIFLMPSFLYISTQNNLIWMITKKVIGKQKKLETC